MIEYIAEKKLEDETTLKLKTWISDVIQPGRRMFQLEIVKVLGITELSINFPINYEDYTETQIKEMYGSIESEADFMNFREKGAMIN